MGTLSQWMAKSLPSPSSAWQALQVSVIVSLFLFKNICVFYHITVICFLVLPEMPLPVPLASTLSSRSLLFHPRVAEEAQRLLSTHDDALAAQLQHALTSTTYNHQHILLRYYNCQFFLPLICFLFNNQFFLFQI